MVQLGAVYIVKMIVRIRSKAFCLLVYTNNVLCTVQR
jgi:hypothetical protein